MFDPLQSYKSKFTGKQIDEGIQKIHTMTPANLGAFNQVAVYYNLESAKSANDLTDGLALIPCNDTINTELYHALGASLTFAYILTGFYLKVASDSRCFQVAWSYGSPMAKMAFRIRSTSWTKWEGVATTDHALMKSDKPSGSYTGNGSATNRTIDTGGIGSAIVVYNTGSASTFALLSHVGGIGRDSSGAVGDVGWSAASFNAGKLYINTTDARLNANGVTYYYQVL